MSAALADTGRRGLRHIDARPDGAHCLRACPHVWRGDVNVIAGQPSKQIQQTPVAFETAKRDKGSALGLADAPMANMVRRIVVCANVLMGHALTLAPASALVVTLLDEANVN